MISDQNDLDADSKIDTILLSLIHEKFDLIYNAFMSKNKSLLNDIKNTAYYFSDSSIFNNPFSIKIGLHTPLSKIVCERNDDRAMYALYAGAPYWEAKFGCFFSKKHQALKSMLKENYQWDYRETNMIYFYHAWLRAVNYENAINLVNKWCKFTPEEMCKYIIRRNMSILSGALMGLAAKGVSEKKLIELVEKFEYHKHFNSEIVTAGYIYGKKSSLPLATGNTEYSCYAYAFTGKLSKMLKCFDQLDNEKKNKAAILIREAFKHAGYLSHPEVVDYIFSVMQKNVRACQPLYRYFHQHQIYVLRFENMIGHDQLRQLYYRVNSYYSVVLQGIQLVRNNQLRMDIFFTLLSDVLGVTFGNAEVIFKTMRFKFIHQSLVSDIQTYLDKIKVCSRQMSRFIPASLKESPLHSDRATALLKVVNRTNSFTQIKKLVGNEFLFFSGNTITINGKKEKQSYAHNQGDDYTDAIAKHHRRM